MEDRLEALESAEFALDDAIDAMKRLGDDYGMAVDCLRDMLREVRADAETIRNSIADEYAANDEAIMREYYKAV